jgi:crotonobetainyl-CoA:carnitine CoA-transferase CaiB-like acyl-CoA transferase
MVKQEKAEPMLAQYRVLDLTDEKGLYCGQLLGSLGADVIKVEKPSGDPARNIGPFYHDIPDPEKSLFWFAYNTNKRGITLNIETADGKEIFKQLVTTADVVIESFPPGYMDKLGLGYSELEKINPGLIMTSITPFGQTGPYKDYKASDLVCWAMGGLLAQTGDPDRPPVRISHINFAFLMGSMDAAWSTAITLYWRGSSGEGQQVDVSIQESMAKTIYLAHETWEVTAEERQRGSSFYKVAFSEATLRTVWPVKDGYLYLMLHGGEFGGRENPRLVGWIEEEGMADDFLKGIKWPELDWRGKSQEEVEQIHDYFARFFKTKTKTEIMEGSLSKSIVLQPINAPRDILEHPQLEARDYWQELEHADLGTTIRYPRRFCLPSESPCKLWRRAPLIGEHNEEIYHKELGFSNEKLLTLKQGGIIQTVKGRKMAKRVLDGVKIAAFEQALAGPLTTTILASYGAEVVRIETGTRLDWHRQAGPFIGNVSLPDRSVPYLFVNAGKFGVTLNLRKPEAIEVAKRIIMWADVVVENFAGGVMARLGLGYENIRKIKPDIIMLSAGIYGQTGPFAEVKGHGGPLTALTGFPLLSGFPDQIPQFPGFAITDFIAPRANVLAIVAALDYRRRTGKGQYIDASQFECAVHLLSPVLLEYEVNGREAQRIGNRSTYAAPHGVYRCKGDDRWCAITVFNDEEWDKFCQAIGSPVWTKNPEFSTLRDRLENQDKLDRLVEEWTINHSPEEAMKIMQVAGVAAGVVQSGQDLGNDPQLKRRQFYWKLEHPSDIGNFTYSGMPARLSKTPYEMRRAPMLGEHNEHVCTQLLGMPDEEFIQLMGDGVFD